MEKFIIVTYLAIMEKFIAGSLVLLPLADHFGRESGVGLNLNDSIKLSVVDEHLFSVNPARDYKKFEMVKEGEKNYFIFETGLLVVV